MILYTDLISGDATGVFNDALAKLKIGERLIIPDDMEYEITEPLIEPAVKYWSMGGVTNSLPTIYYTGTGPIITLEQAGAITDLKINGRDDVNVDGIRVKDTSNFTLERLKLNHMGTALIFDNAHDSRQLYNISCAHNQCDIKTVSHSSSLHFNNISMLLSEQAVSLEAATTNFTFDNCTIAPAPSSDLPAFSIDSVVFQMAICGSRFELKDRNREGTYDSLSINGNSHKYAAQQITISENYFTGKAVRNHIKLGKYCRNISIENNYFMTDPSEADINSGTEKIVLHNNNPAIHLRRELMVTYQ